MNDVSFAIREGEIVGVAGVAGNGQRELAEALSGMRDLRAGSVRVGGRAPATAAIRARRSPRGVAHVPEDRLGTGLAPSLSVASNVVHQDVPQLARCRAGRSSRCGACASAPSGSSAATT